MGQVVGWIRQQGYVFFDNASSKKDFRVQLRGPKTLVLWCVYLLLLALLAYISYATLGSSFGWSSSSDGHVPLEEAQSRLQSFYGVMLALLAGMVSLVAPAIGASAVVSERQRRFLDLLFSSPMSGQYYLVGKLISSYRYIWMLLILAIPMVAVGAVLGGATYGDVFESFLVISLDGLVFSAVGIALSAGATKLPSAIIFSYLSTVAIIVISTIVCSSSMIRMPHAGTVSEMPVVGMLSLFLVSQTLPTSTMVGTVTVPNWLLFVPVALLIVQVCLLGGTSALSEKSMRSTVWFRAAMLVLLVAASYTIVGLGSGFPRLFTAGSPSSTTFATVMPWLFIGCLCVTIAIPFIGCFVADGPRKFCYDGSPKFRNTFRALPSGSLFYVLAMVVAIFLGAAIRLAPQGDFGVLKDCACYMVWVIGLYLLTWSVCRVTSQIGGTLTAARGLATIFMALCLAIPAIVGGILSNGEFVWPGSPLSPIAKPDLTLALCWGAAMMVIGVSLSFARLPKFMDQIQNDGRLAA